MRLLRPSTHARRRVGSHPARRGRRRLAVVCGSVGTVDLTTMLVRDGSPTRWHVLDWGAVALLLAVGLIIAGWPEASSWAPSREHR